MSEEQEPLQRVMSSVDILADVAEVFGACLGNGRVILLCAGTSVPNGLSNMRFDWLALPASLSTIIQSLNRSLDIDLREREAAIAWGDDAGDFSHCVAGTIAYVVRVRGNELSLDELERLAREVDDEDYPAEKIVVQRSSVLAAAGVILGKART